MMAVLRMIVALAATALVATALVGGWVEFSSIGHRTSGRYVPMPSAGSAVVLDTATGQLCQPRLAAGLDGLPICGGK